MTMILKDADEFAKAKKDTTTGNEITSSSSSRILIAGLVLLIWTIPTTRRLLFWNLFRGFSVMLFMQWTE
jgi:hypothetical protein